MRVEFVRGILLLLDEKDDETDSEDDAQGQQDSHGHTSGCKNVEEGH